MTYIKMTNHYKRWIEFRYVHAVFYTAKKVKGFHKIQLVINIGRYV